MFLTGNIRHEHVIAIIFGISCVGEFALSTSCATVDASHTFICDLKFRFRLLNTTKHKKSIHPYYFPPCLLLEVLIFKVANQTPFLYIL